MAARFLVAMVLLAVMLGACSTSNTYERTDRGYCIHHYQEHWFGVRVQSDKYPAKKCPKGVAK